MGYEVEKLNLREKGGIMIKNEIETQGLSSPIQ